jgi:hypothetical protein
MKTKNINAKHQVVNKLVPWHIVPISILHMNLYGMLKREVLS